MKSVKIHIKQKQSGKIQYQTGGNHVTECRWKKDEWAERSVASHRVGHHFIGVIFALVVHEHELVRDKAQKFAKKHGHGL